MITLNTWNWTHLLVVNNNLKPFKYDYYLQLMDKVLSPSMANVLILVHCPVMVNAQTN